MYQEDHNTGSNKGRTIQAIPQVYKGIQFRSRLEARWAIFFDHLGIAWHYEFEGYQLPSGWYVPDFWLPDVGPGTFVEVKPFEGAGDNRIFELAEATDKKCFLVWGNPKPVDGTGYTLGCLRYLERDFEELYVEDGYNLCMCAVCGKIDVVFSGGEYWERICEHEVEDYNAPFLTNRSENWERKAAKAALTAEHWSFR